MPNVEIGQAIGQSFRFIGTAWARAWGILLIVVWLAAALAAVQAIRPEWTATPFIGLILNAFASTAMLGALFRIGVETRHAGDEAFRAHAGGLQWGALEWRVLGANWVIGLVFTVALVVIGVIWAVVVGVSAASDQADVQALATGDTTAKGQALLHLIAGPAGIATLVIGLPTLVAGIYFGARLLLYPLVAADTRGFGFGPAWGLTRGAVLAIVLTGVLSFLAQIVLALLAGALAGIVAGISGQVASAPVWGGVAAQAVGVAIGGPIAAGLQLYVYKTRRGGEDVAATFA